MIKNVLQKLTERKDLTAEEAYSLIVAIKNDELSDVQIAGFQVALLMKGPTLTEISAIAQAMRDNCIPIRPNVNEEFMDTCGTGGGLSTFNISTSVAFVAAAAGIQVAKHGSRSISSLSGSADVLEALNVEINLSTKAVEKLIEDVGISFLYAPLYHPVMGKVLPPEKDLGIKTIFYTIIGPLINPAKATKHVLGVYRPELLDTVSQVALSLGYKRALFVHGLDGLDEISLLGKTRIQELNNGKITTYEITPEDFGMSRCTLEEIATGTPEENANMIRNVFSGKDKGPRRQAVVLNAAGALMIGDKADSFVEGIKLANELIDSGAAQQKLNDLITASNDYKVRM
ncbi:anthranilate phosphoribosyltransferase [Schinkia azotoformans]|uniref:Anthranilate phosphoribosyltransferase n=1 Tax=Schinkia azotoformans LMG 9581 TaxID=1131731 RepID=K6D3U7_SCHAZ|nr:anthranilate phosphoribosyltransferase [Schinkia azotoformans]EKN67167.1 anthranilate phosphoribosyltransferase [Schinkia azotoformans LMG 9581]MEC1639848.1 anthranilate phosphoribosyltransferase [Schinkia azotoformans]MEC1947245.1 anthranilate phosphoribosyltransferase [Schinkia azotoformans]